MGEVDDHPQPVQFDDHLPAEVGQATAVGDVGGRIRPADVLVVGERQVAHPEPGQHPQHPQRTADAVPALGAQQRRDPAVLPGGAHVVGGPGELQVVEAGDHRVAAVDLLQGLHHGLRRRQGAGHPHRPELGAHPAGPQPRQIGVRRGHPGRQVEAVEVETGLDPCPPEQVVVGVDDARFQVPGGGGAHSGSVEGAYRRTRAAPIAASRARTSSGSAISIRSPKGASWRASWSALIALTRKRPSSNGW